MSYSEGSLHQCIQTPNDLRMCTKCRQPIPDGAVFWIYPRWSSVDGSPIKRQHCEDCLLAAGAKRFYHVWYTIYSRGANDPEEVDKEPHTMVDTPHLHVAIDAVRSAEHVFAGILIDPGIEIGGLRAWGRHLCRVYGGHGATFPPDILERAERERLQYELQQVPQTGAHAPDSGH